MFHDIRFRVLCLALLSMTALASIGLAQESEAPPTETQLLATLENADAPLFDRMMACKQLGVAGTEKAVPVLAGLLGDKELSHLARYGLEPIPSPEVDVALKKALSTVKGRELIGVINSIANRGKPEAIDALAAKLDDTDRTVATAAAHSIARLGTLKAAEILGKDMSAEMAPALLVCGKTIAEQGHKTEAAELLMTLCRSKDAPMHVRLATVCHVGNLQRYDGMDMLCEFLMQEDKRAFNAGLRAARLIEPADATKMALLAIKDASGARRAQLVTLLGDLADPADPVGLPVVVEAAKSDNADVRIAALEALGTLGTAEHVTLLMDAAMDPTEEVAAEAQKSLGALAGDEVDRAVLAALDSDTRRALAVRMIGRRRITAAVPKLLTLMKQDDTKLEAITALGETISLKELDVLAEQLDTESTELREVVHAAMHAACYRMPDRDATAVKLAGYLRGASEETVKFVMDELRQVGGPKALSAVAQAAGSKNTTRKDYATQALGGWLDTSAAPVLIALAQSEGRTKYGIRGLRAYIRLARQFSMPEDQRAAMCRRALKTADRDEEKKLVLEVLGRYPSAEMLAIAVDVAKTTPSLKSDAEAVAAAIARKIGRK